MPILIHKVFAYITHGQRLLVFRHADFPQAGIQVPAGTVQPDEHPDEAVLREVYEETGLSDFAEVYFLGEQIRDMRDFNRDEVHHRYFYHLPYTGDSLTTWRHDETSGGATAPIVFEFFWVTLPNDVPELIADHDKFMPALLQRLSIEQEESTNT
jgi:8-oxo-dGTP pyrophosphatase MutT (NUDIX family)